MKLTLESTGLIETVNGNACRLWKGKTESGIACHVWIAAIAAPLAADQAEFERELREIAVERRVTAYDMKVLI
jgi:hypothetical protein